MFFEKYKTEEEQLAAIIGDCWDEIKYIYNPSLKVQLAAVKKDGYAIRFINNPSEEVQLEAVKEDSNAIKFIHNPALSVIKYIIENCDNLETIQTMRIDFEKLPDELRLLLEMKF